MNKDSYYQDPQGFFARLRESRPVAPVRMPAYGRAWVVTRYKDVRAVLADPRMAKDVHRWPGGGRSRPSEATGVYAHMLHADPPEHTRLRRLVQKPFASRRAIASADWDPVRFPEPDRLDLGRDTSGHLAFGHGVHHCLGAPLARMAAEVALGALLARFPRITLAVPSPELRWRPVSLDSLPIRLG